MNVHAEHNTAVALQEQQRTPVQNFVGSVLSGDKRDEIMTVLPAHVTFERFERNFSNAVMRDPKMLKADPRVVFREVCKIAALGLVLDPQLGEAYLIVDRNNDVQARIGYRGLMKLAHQSGKVSAIYAHDICQNDHCEISLGTEKRISHRPDFTQPRGPALAYYAVVQFKDGATDFEPMSIAEINAIRDRSDAYRAFKSGFIKKTPWDSDHGEMAKKTTLRRLLKRVPMSPDLERALAMEDDADERDRLIVDNATGEIRPSPRSLAERMDMLAAQPTEDAATYHVESDAAAGGAATPPTAQSADEPPTKTLADYDTDLGMAAKSGTAALQAAWGVVPAGMKKSLKAALDRRHKSTAEAADAAEEKTSDKPPRPDQATAAATQAGDEAQAVPTTQDEYVSHARAWFGVPKDAEAARAMICGRTIAAGRLEMLERTAFAPDHSPTPKPNHKEQ